MRIHQIRNATLKIDYNGKTFLVDPMFAPKGENLPMNDKCILYDLPLPQKDIVKNADAVILTNLHADHFDKYAEDILPKSIKIFVQDIFDKNALEKSHFNNIEVLKAEGTDFEGVKLFKTECMHGVREKAEPVFLANGMRWEAMGIVFKSDREPVLYLAGDTVWFYGVKDAIDKYNPQYIVVNASCAEIGKSGVINMGIEDIRALHKYIPQAVIVASHLDCVEHETTERKILKTSEVSEYTYIPANGELMIFEK